MPDKSSCKANYRKLAALSSLGLMLPSSIAVGLFMGYLLDKLFGTHPWLLAFFTLLGVASGSIHIPTVAREVFDVTGAGDTVIAAAALSLLAGASIAEAASLSNAAASIVVGKIGTASVSPKELLAALLNRGL